MQNIPNTVMTMSDNEITHHVNESADKVTVKTDVKRGTGTRDQDKLTVKVKGDEPAEVVEKVNETVARLHKTAEDLRAMQPNPDNNE
jgi:hypothetical protein